MDLTRRFFLLGTTALGLLAAEEALAASRRRSQGRRSSPSRSRRGRGGKAEKSATAPEPPKKPAGQTLRIPELVTLKDGETYTLTVKRGEATFMPEKPVPVTGYNGGYLGPAFKFVRGTAPVLRLVNELDRATNVHWHGLIAPGAAGGGPLPVLEPGASADIRMTVDQNAATLWYHAQMPGWQAIDLTAGLAGLALVEDPATASLGLPSDWGVDDIPLLIQDREFDDAGNPVYARTADVVEHGFRGRRILVNGTLDAVAAVPQRLVRLRIVNGSSARVYRIYFADERAFKLIATDGGFLPTPVDADTVGIAPGERIEILVDFADGGTALMSTPDDHELRAGTRTVKVADVLTAPFRICAFHTERDGKPSAKVPAKLAPAPVADPASAVRRRRFVLQLGGAVALSASSAHSATAGSEAAPEEMPVMAINGKTYDPTRIDEEVALGTTEIWDIVAPEMSYPFHLQGAQFRVLSEDGGIPKIWNRGIKDTVLVENSTSLLVTFTKPAGRDAPYLYHCQILEHADAGMIGTFTVT
ncbi:copper oxidase [Prosthecomicrobium hirschii]|uniref:multicopper oxidase family protein n=1 Tax=Prosthecodimorpha hirschii TaxID=665126 RepID=UPI00112DECA3|nr:multicopper oxidase domain-containing protein [Prosthecomicrobium hirschii]TPQ46843.1 copper oxidase [Prosthecomicrobium hirschii]